MTTIAHAHEDDETVGRHTFAPGVELLTVSWPDGRRAATIIQEVDRDVTPAELRALADTWEAYPGWLRGLAAELEARS